MASYRTPEDSRRQNPKSREKEDRGRTGKKNKLVDINPYDRLVPTTFAFATPSPSPSSVHTKVNKSKTADKGIVSTKKNKQLQRSDFLIASTNVERVEDNISNLLSDLSLTSTEKKEADDVPVVVYYAWFFKEDVCAALKEISEAYLRQCFFSVAQFERFLTSVTEKNGGQDPLAYYRYPSRKRQRRHLPDYHVTAKFCGQEKSVCEEYWPQVAHLIGTSSSIHIIGIFFTEKSCGFRIKLSEDQKEIFDERNITLGSRSSNSSSVNGAVCTSNNISAEDVDLNGSVDSELFSPSKNQYYPTENQSKSSDSHSTELKYAESEYHPCIFVCPQEKDFTPSDSRAHITIGTSPLVNAVQTGEDLKDLVDLEARSSSSPVFHTDYVLENGDTLRQFGQGDAFILYLSHMLITDGVFNFKQ